MSIPGTPSRSRSVTRPGSPSPGGASRSDVRRLTCGRTSGDPLRVFPTHLSQRIFGFLDISDLAKCARVCKKWCSSQSINYGKVRRFRLGDLLLTFGQCGFEDIVKRIFMTKVSLLGNGLDESRSKIGYDPSPFWFEALTDLSRESYTSNQFLRGSQSLRDIQPPTPALVTNHRGR